MLTCAIFPILGLIVLLVSQRESSLVDKVSTALRQPGLNPLSDQKKLYDEKKWNALVQYDPEINKIHYSLKPHGQDYVDQLAEAYMAINDKSYLEKIHKAILEKIKQDTENGQEKLRKKLNDPDFITNYIQTHRLMLLKSKIGPIIRLPDDSIIAEVNGSIVKFKTTKDFRGNFNDRTRWDSVTDIQSTLKVFNKYRDHV